MTRLDKALNDAIRFAKKMAEKEKKEMKNITMLKMTYQRQSQLSIPCI